MTAAEMAAALDTLQTMLDGLDVNPMSWNRDQLDAAIDVWDRLDQLATTASIMRRDHGVVLARRLPDEYTAGPLTVHRTVEKTEAWDGHAVLGELAQPVITADGERIHAIPLDTARDVLPACGQGATSSKWKVVALRQRIPDIDKRLRSVTYGDAVIARGPLAYQARRRAKRADAAATEPSSAPEV